MLCRDFTPRHPLAVLRALLAGGAAGCPTPCPPARPLLSAGASPGAMGGKQHFPGLRLQPATSASRAGRGDRAGAPWRGGPSEKMGERSRPAKGCHGQAAQPTGAGPAASKEGVGAGIGLFLLTWMKTGKYPFCPKPPGLRRGTGSWTEPLGRGGRADAGQGIPMSRSARRAEGTGEVIVPRGNPPQRWGLILPQCR